MVTGRPLPDALAAELIPTGTFGGPRPTPAYAAAIDPRAAEHVADLLAGLAGTRDYRAARRRAHLRVVSDDERAAS